ncbi:parvalbumin alpha-like [Spea bombifrons]|uniref:parvalbumin alpha-like n=1 Tax=Spea bombifrons TaxID=233779 RepID=UPI00234ACD65|nr:parvalbumin alpha-like [Spea bombifrons]
MALVGMLSEADISSALQSCNAPETFNPKIFIAKSGLKRKTKEELKKVFQILDQNKSGFLEEVDLKMFLKNFNHGARTLTDIETKSFMKTGDANHDGKIGLDDFQALVRAENVAVPPSSRCDSVSL